MIFIQASKQKFRFPSTKGELTAEQLWDLPLQSKSGFDLDNVAKAVNAQLKAVTEESFVSSNERPEHSRLLAMLEVVKYVIADRLKAAEEMRSRLDKAQKREKLLSLLEKKQDAALESLSAEEIAAQIAAL